MRTRLILLIFSFLLVAIAAFVWFFLQGADTAQQATFSAFTQNFQNLSMPIVTTLSVIFLYFSIQQNTEQNKISAHKQEIESLDNLISIYENNLHSFLGRSVDLPYAIKFILADKGSDEDMKQKWDVNRLILQLNCYLSISENVSQSNVRPAMYDLLNIDLKHNGTLIGYTLSTELLEIVDLLTKRAELTKGESRNTHLFKKLQGLVTVLQFSDWLGEEEVKQITNLEFREDESPVCYSADSVESPSEFAARVQILSQLSPIDLRLKSAQDVIDILDKKVVPKPQNAA